MAIFSKGTAVYHLQSRGLHQRHMDLALGTNKLSLAGRRGGEVGAQSLFGGDGQDAAADWP